MQTKFHLGQEVYCNGKQCYISSMSLLHTGEKLIVVYDTTANLPDVDNRFGKNGSSIMREEDILTVEEYKQKEIAQAKAVLEKSNTQEE